MRHLDRATSSRDTSPSCCALHKVLQLLSEREKLVLLNLFALDVSPVAASASAQHVPCAAALTPATAAHTAAATATALTTARQAMA